MKNMFFVLLFFSVMNVFPQNTDSIFSGNIYFDSQIAFENTINKYEINIKEKGEKSVFLSALLSFALPGAGEFYAESFWKAGLFFAVEVASIATGIIYNNKGNDQTAFFENYADERWSVAKYAKWTYDNRLSDEQKLNYQNLFYDVQKTQVNWAVLNNMEREVDGYSHSLAPYGDQQYYEMIGKYSQFNTGWDDFDLSNTTYAYPEPVTSHFNYYSGLRGTANDYYGIAQTAVVVIVANHLLSALDAAWTTSNYNKSIQISAEIDRIILANQRIYYPKLNLQFNF
ncbi:MAG: hypothetical protein JXA68_07190 [Ignavibacteriales bacterium]|nr:hypothetical protein [Ignavibacteriales bacterium]